MKKRLLLLAVLTFGLLLPVLAQEKVSESTTHVWDHGDNISSISYRNARIYKILDSKDAYIVLYEKGSTQVGTTIIPKSWAKDQPRALLFRNKPAELDPYMTVMYQNGEFYKIWITVSPNRLNSVWGVANSGTKVDLPSLDSYSIEF